MLWETWKAFSLNNIILVNFSNFSKYHVYIHIPATFSYQNSFKLSVLLIIMLSRSYFKAEVAIERRF